MEASSVYKLSYLIPLLIWSVQVDGRQPNKLVEVGLQFFFRNGQLYVIANFLSMVREASLWRSLADAHGNSAHRANPGKAFG
jgi:hypothetical protein